jgi:quercetin dioxygenase-like cupin family protein
MEEQKVFVENEDKEWENVSNGVKRKIMAFDEQLMVVKVEFERGGIGIIHQHFHHQITHIQSGLFEVIINNEKKVLKEGDAFYIPPHMDHGCVCIKEGILIDIFSPMRKDFIADVNKNQEVGI